MEIPGAFLDNYQQGMFFIFSCLLGIPCGIIFDIFRTVRILIPHKNSWLVIIEDIIFLFLCAVIILIYVSILPNRNFRFLYVLGEFLGFILYFTTVGNFIIGIYRKIFNFLINVIKKFNFKRHSVLFKIKK